MLITDAADAMRQAGMDLVPLPALMAANIHKTAARVDPDAPDTTNEQWATLRGVAEDITELDTLDDPVGRLIQAIADIKVIVEGM